MDDDSRSPRRPRVNPSLLRDADTGCPRRLALGLTGRDATSPTANARFRLLNRFEDAADLAQLRMGPPRAEVLVPPPDLFPEEVVVFRLAASHYLTIFDEPARSVPDLDWQVDVPELDVTLSMRRPLVFERDDGSRELRLLALRRDARRPFPDEEEVALNAIRARGWFGAAPLRVVSADLVHGVTTTTTLDPDAHHAAAIADLAPRVATLGARADEQRPRRSLACGFCTYLPCQGHGGPLH